MTPLVSCIMPTADRARFIPGAFACFLAQDYPNKELIILDDGEQPVMDLVPLEDSRITYCYSGAPKQTVGSKRNQACSIAKGDIIATWDDDDWNAPDRISRQVETLITNPGTQLTGFSTVLFWDEVQQKGWRYHHKNYACGTSQVYWRAWWDKNRFSNRNLGEDSDFSFRAKRQGVLLAVDGGQQIVVRMHDKRTSDTQINGAQFTSVARENFPAGFLACASI